jgi:hypothetical protein
MKYGKISWELKHFEYTLDAYKNIDSFGESLRAAIRQLWAGEIGYEEFLDVYQDAIRRGLHDAANEGALEMGFNPLLDPFERSWVDREIMEQFIFIPALALFILANNRLSGYPLESLYSRANVWQNVYNRVNNEAVSRYGGNQKLMWQRGGTKKPCTTCLTLNGVVALASDWDAYVHKPQSFSLECHGFNCKCGLYATSAPLTRGGIPFV